MNEQDWFHQFCIGGSLIKEFSDLKNDNIWLPDVGEHVVFDNKSYLVIKITHMYDENCTEYSLAQAD